MSIQTLAVTTVARVPRRIELATTRCAFLYVLANRKAFIPGAIAAVITADLNCSTLSGELIPAKYTNAGCRIIETKIIKHIVKPSPAGRYWYKAPPSAKRAVGSAAFFIILRLFQIGVGMGIPKVLTTKPKNIANINGFLKTKLKILLNTFVKLVILLLLWHNSIERMPMK